MPTYSARTLKPTLSELYSVEAVSPEDAAQELLIRHPDLALKYIDRTDGRRQDIHFALTSVDGREMFARYFSTGIYRQGAKPREIDRQDFMAKLGWTDSWENLVGEWEGESDEWF